jgi:hypothetical protein
MDERVATTRGALGAGSDTRRFVYAPDGRVLGEYGANASDVKAEFIWMSPEAGESGTFGGDDGLSGYMPLAVAHYCASITKYTEHLLLRQSRACIGISHGHIFGHYWLLRYSTSYDLA